MGQKEQFLEIYRDKIHRQGSDALLAWIERTDFFDAPASTRFHLACSGGLCTHSLNVYHRLVKLLSDPDDRKICFSPSATDEEIEESIAIVSLLHDLCKANFYVPGFRNVKNSDGKWERVPSYEINERFPYGHGEKSCFLIQNHMALTAAEGTAIRWHMGAWDDAAKSSSFNTAWEKYPLGAMLHVADLLASKMDERNS